MTVYDAAMVGLIVAGMVWGAFRGITWQVASIASLVLGYSVSHPLSGRLAGSFPGEPVVARALAMLAIYAAVSGGVFVVAWLIRATLRKLKFEAFDRHLGMLLGGMEGALLGLVITLFVVSLAPQTRDPIFASPTGKVVGQFMAAVGPVLPDEARGVLAPFWSSSPAASGSKRIADREPTPPDDDPDRPAAGSREGASPATLKDLIEEGETRLGRVIADGAAEGIRRAAGGGGGSANDRAAERR
jgi:membrane protein required for colicin V production